MPEPQLHHTAGLLAAMTWRRNFRRDAQLRKRVFLQEVQQLVAALKNESTPNHAPLHPSHKLSIEIKTTFAVLLQEESANTQLASCYLNTETNPKLELSFRVRGVEVDTTELAIDCYSPHGYVWTQSEGDVLTSREAAEMILRRVFKIATDAIVSETP